jgi:hypothetical protein
MNDVADQNTGGRRSVDFKIVFTCSFLLGLLFLVALRTNGWRLSLPSWISLSAKSGPAGPEETIYGMLDAARAGDTNAYLDMFSETMRDQLLQGMKENVNSNFAAYLKSQNAAFQGVAVSVTGRPSDNEAQVRVEYVYSNRDEVQTVYLRKNSRWRIVKVAGAEQVMTLLPFGSAVTD